MRLVCGARAVVKVVWARLRVCVSGFLYHSPAALVFQYAKENKNNNEMNKRLIFKWSAVVSVVTDAEHCPSRLSACLLLVPISQLAKSRKKNVT